MNKEDLDFTNAAAKIKNRVTVPAYYFEKLPQEIRKLAFTVSNIETIRQIEIVKQSLNNAQEQGLSFREWRERLDTDSITNLSKARLETVYRTNMANVYSSSTRYNASTSSVTPYLMFKAVGDSRTRQSHLQLDGVIKLASSDFWDKHSPPLSYNCRCHVIPLSKREAEKRGISRASPDDFDTGGFSSQKLGDVNSGVNKDAKKIEDALPKNSPYRQKFIEAQNNIDSLVDVWWQQSENKFK